MSTTINVTVDDGGLPARNRQQTAANRQAFVQGQASQQAAQQGADQRAADRRAAGLDPATGRPLPSAGASSRLPRIQQEPAANRKGGHLLFIVPSSAPTTAGSYTLPDQWSDLFPTGNPPRRWWNPTAQRGFRPRLSFLEPPIDDPGQFIPGVLVDGYVTYNEAEQCFEANNNLITAQPEVFSGGRSMLHYSIAGSAFDSIRNLRTITVELEILMQAIPDVIYNGNSIGTGATIRLFSRVDDDISGSISISINSSGSIAIPNTGPNAGIDQGGYSYTVSLGPASDSFTAASVNFNPSDWMAIKVVIDGGSLALNQEATDGTLTLQVKDSIYSYSLSDSNFSFIRPLFVANKHNFVILGSVGQDRALSNPHSPAPANWKMRNVRYTFA